jgi:hypothetical protein
MNNNKFDEPRMDLTQSGTRPLAFMKFGVGIAAIVLACFGIASVTQAQTSVVCDPAGDTTIHDGKGGPAVPSWLDIIQGVVAADPNGVDILFTLTVNAPVPNLPVWNHIDDGGQLWWGWRLVGSLAGDTLVQNGCIAPNGVDFPASYFVDLIWDVQSSSFQARLLDDTSCTQIIIPFFFSADRTQMTLVVTKTLLSNKALIPDPNNFQFVATTASWTANTTGNNSFAHLDWAPNLGSYGQIVVGSWSSSVNTSSFCQ